jgi:peptide/nickel transport system permease protein
MANGMHNFRQRFSAYRAGVAAAVYLVAIVLVAIVIELIPGLDPHEISDKVMAAPGAANPLGTDDLGRDVLLGILFGIKVSLSVGICAAIGATVFGVLIGAIAGYYGGWLDLIVMRISEVFQVVPTFVLAAFIIALSGPGLSRVVVVIALLSWPQVARLMRGEVLRVKQLEFVDAVRCLGVKESSILAHEVIPNAIAPVLAAATLIVGHAILLEAALGFFGLSSADIVSWGRMLNAGQRFLFNAPWLSFFPGMAIFITVLAFNLLGDAIGSALNPKTQKKAG